MSLDNFSQLEEKINKALGAISQLKTEKENLQEAKQHLEMRVQHLHEEVERLKNENDEYREKLDRTSSMEAELENELKDKINSYIGKIDDVLGSDV